LYIETLQQLRMLSMVEQINEEIVLADVCTVYVGKLFVVVLKVFCVLFIVEPQTSSYSHTLLVCLLNCVTFALSVYC